MHRKSKSDGMYLDNLLLKAKVLDNFTRQELIDHVL